MIIPCCSQNSELASMGSEVLLLVSREHTDPQGVATGDVTVLSLGQLAGSKHGLGHTPTRSRKPESAATTSSENHESAQRPRLSQ